MQSSINPLVTVITITRNRGKVIRRAIESVLNQTYKNFEYIIIDGASEDDTEKIVRSYCAIDSRINYILQEVNKSVIFSIDDAFKMSKGEYITFLDDDDEYMPQKIEKQLKLIMQLDENYGFVYCWMDCYDHQTGKLIKEYHETIKGDILPKLLTAPIIGGTPVFLFRRKAFKLIDGWNKKSPLISDWEMICRAANNYKTDVVTEPLVKVYVNHGNTRMSNNNIYSEEYINSRIIFHYHFLQEFNDTFRQNADLKLYHLYPVLKYHLMLGNYSEAKGIIKECILINPFGIKLIIAMTRGLLMRYDFKLNRIRANK